MAFTLHDVAVITSVCAVLIVAGLLLGLPVEAQTTEDLCRTHTVSQNLATNTAGTFTFCIRTGEAVQRAGQAVRLTASVTSTATLTGANPSLSLTLNGLDGCTAGTPTTSGTNPGTTTGPAASSTWKLTVTGDRCTFYVRMTATSAGTTISDMAVAGNVAIKENWATVIYDFAWLIWIIGVLLTRLIQNLPVRIVADFVLDGIVFLPMEDQLRLFLIGAGVVLVAVDLVLLILAAIKAGKGGLAGKNRTGRNRSPRRRYA